jgi:radical SAM protein with 4Fe4S-binding SPASM domain
LKKHAARIVDLGTDHVTVSIDGVGSLKAIRGISIDSILEGIDAVNLEKRRKGRMKPILSANVVLMKENLKEFPDLVALAADHGIAHINAMHIVMHSEILLDNTAIPMAAELESIFSDASRIAREKNMTLSLPIPTDSHKHCRDPFLAVYINWNGDVRPCCSSTINEPNSITLGNLAGTTLPDIWNSIEMRRLRREVYTEKGMRSFCRKCPARTCSLDSHTRIL